MTINELITELEKYPRDTVIYVNSDGWYSWPIAVEFDSKDKTVSIRIPDTGE